jgi:tRNA (cmo5U34)-methyltransferase
MSHSVRKHLRVEIDEYDDQIRRFIPAYETMIAVAADAVAAVEPNLVIDLGAGTGGLSELLLDRRGVGTVELLDIDPEMLDKARRRLERFGDRARFTLRSYDEPLPPCAAFAASLSLHHIPTIEAKAELYARAFSALRPGGVLVNADTNMPTNRAERDRLFRYWANHMVARGIPEDRAWQYFDEWADEDAYMPLEAELAELTRAGFEAARVWNDGPEGVVVARKP